MREAASEFNCNSQYNVLGITKADIAEAHSHLYIAIPNTEKLPLKVMINYINVDLLGHSVDNGFLLGATRF